ncbi:MAG: FecR domain-containing protein [Gemmatimonadetes bacterium]|nr:FecR domain-containing protein [Gemmatimonadota bacterium]
MSLSIPGLTADLLSKLKSGDLGALETLFRAAFPSLMAKAKETLGDDGAAARVVERLIPKLFADRASFTSPADLTAMLDGALHEAAVRERSRLAGIRKRDDGKSASSGPAPTVDDVWGKVINVIKGPSAEALAQAEQMKDKLRHEAGGHIREMTKQRPIWVPMLAGLGLLGAVALGGYLFAKSGEKGRLARQISNAVKDIKTGTGQRGNVKLDDGSEAMFGAETRVTLPDEFNELARGVGLEGSAEFTPAAHASLPFQVLAGNVMFTAAPSSKFALRRYKDDEYVIARVKEGSLTVEVQEPNESTQQLTAGQTVLVRPDGSTAQPTEAQLNEAFGYVDGTFAIDQKPLRHTLAMIKRWYGTEMFLEDTTMGAQVVSMTAPLTSTTDAIKSVETASGLFFGWEGQTMVLKKPKK